MHTLTPGTTVHLLRGSKYAGAWELAEVGEPDANGWQHLRTVDHGPMTVREWYSRPEDAFASEAEARAEGRNRRAPRRQRQIAGEWGQAALLVTALDRTARQNRS
jgi:hypothetical protein